MKAKEVTSLSNGFGAPVTRRLSAKCSCFHLSAQRGRDAHRKRRRTPPVRTSVRARMPTRKRSSWQYPQKAWNRRTARGKTREAFLPGKRTTLRFSKHVIRPSGTQTAISSRTKLRSFLGDAYFAAAWYVVVTGRRGRFAEPLNGDGNAEFDASFGDNV